MNIQQCVDRGRALARLERTPLFLLNIYRLKNEGIIGDEQRFFDNAAREAIELIDDFSKYEDLEDCPPHLQLRLARFYQDYVSLLNMAPKVGETNPGDDQIDQIMKVVTDKRQIQKVLDEAVQDLRDGAKLVELHTTSFDIPYIDQFDFSDDPILSKIRKGLGLSLVQ